jgi:hypothetical protein
MNAAFGRVRAYVEAVLVRGPQKCVPGIKEGAQPVPFESADAECGRLREQNARLRKLPTEHNIQIPPAEPASRPCVKAVEVLSTEDRQEQARKRVALLQSFFVGDLLCARWPD